MSFSELLCFPGRIAVSKPRLMAMILLVSFAVCILSLDRLTFEDDITKSFTSGGIHSREYQEFQSTLGFTPRQIVVLAESQMPLDEEDFETLQNLALEFALAESVGSVFSVASVRFAPAHDRYSNEPVLLPGLGIQAIEQRILAARSAGIRLAVSADGKSALFVISLAPASENDDWQGTTEQLKRATKEFGGPNLSYEFTGEFLIGPEMVSALKRDLIFNNVAGCLLATVLAFLMFGEIRLIVIGLVPSFLAALISLSLFSILGFPVTVLNTVIPILVLVLALADSIHLTLHFRDNGEDLDTAERIRRTIAEIGPACALTAVTTSIAFAAIAISDNDQLRDLAIIGSISVFVAYIVVLASFAVLAGYFGGDVRQAKNRNWFRIPKHWADQILHHSRRIYALCALIAVLSLVGISNLNPWFNLDEHLPTSSSVRATNQTLVEKFSGFYRIWSELELESDRQIHNEAGWSQLVALTHAIENAAPNYPVISLATYARWLGEPDRMPSQDELERLPDELLKQLISADGRTARVIVLTPESMRNKTALEVQDNIERAALSAGANRSVGLPIVMRYESTSVIRQLGIGLALACVISTLLVAGFYRKPHLAAYLIIPNALPLAVAAGSLALLRGGELTPTAMLALTIAFGVAIDDSIHFVNRFLAEAGRGHSADQALVISIEETGKAMILTTILICSGMLITMLSSFETIRLFGGMLILTFVTALFADLFLLPCLLRNMSVQK